ncbi:MAG: hypothetical protein ABI451_02640 [Dokdonella sp.]
MSKRLSQFRRSLVGVALSLLLVAGSVDAETRERSLQEIVQQVEQDTDGKVLSVQTLQRNGHKIYRVKVLTRDGRMQVVQVRGDE